MPLGERFRSGGTHSVARFLEDHQDHAGGFDVQREQGEGNGRLRILCHGCGQAVEYRAADVGDFAAPGADAATSNGGVPVPVPPEPVTAVPTPLRRPEGVAPPPSGGDRAPSAPIPPAMRGFESRRRRSEPEPRRLPRILATAAIALLILGGIAMIVAGLLRNGNDEGKGTTQAPTQNQSTAPAEPTQAAAKPSQPTRTAPQSTAPSPSASVAPPSLKARRFSDFSVGVPASWQTGEQDQATLLSAPGGVAEVDVFVQQVPGSSSQLVTQTGAFLAERNPGAQIGQPRPARIGRIKGRRIVATSGSGTETATLLQANGSTFLVIERKDQGAPTEIVGQADAIVASFRPA